MEISLRKRPLGGCDEEKAGRKEIRRRVVSGEGVDIMESTDIEKSDEDCIECPTDKCGRVSKEFDAVRCKLCCQCCYEPTLLNCSHTFCHNCLTDHLIMDASCPICRTTVSSIAPDESMERKVKALFPNFKLFRQKMTYVMEKTMFLGLQQVRARLENLRQLFTQYRNEKLAVLAELKQNFYEFYELHLEEQRVDKEYRSKLKEFDSQNKFGAVIGTRPESGSWNGLPELPCCLDTLIEHTASSLLRTPEDLITSYDVFLNGIDISSPIVGTCGVCGRHVNLLPLMGPELYPGGGVDILHSQMNYASVRQATPSFLV